LQKNPDDMVTKSHITLLAESYQHRADVLKVTMGNMLEAERVVLVAGATLQNYMDVALTQASSGNVEGTKSAVKRVSAAAKHISNVASAELENTENEAHKVLIKVWYLGEGKYENMSLKTTITTGRKLQTSWKMRVQCMRVSYSLWLKYHKKIATRRMC